MEHIVKPALILTLIVFFSALILSYAKKITDSYILRHEIDRQNQAVRLVLNGYTIGEELIARFDDGTEFSYWVGTKIEGAVEKKAYAFISTVHGNKRNIATPPTAAWQSNFISTVHGNISAMVGIDEDDKILRVSIIHQTEPVITFFDAVLTKTIVDGINDSIVKLKSAKLIIENDAAEQSIRSVE